MFRVAGKLYRQHGLPHFYRGLSTCLVRAFCVSAAMFPLYEGTAALLWEAEAAGRNEDC